MTITWIGWAGGGYDLHLLPGETSQPLNERLIFTQSGSTDIFQGDNPPDDVDVSFSFLFSFHGTFHIAG